MDALEFLKERKRMCNGYKDCIGCPLKGEKCDIRNFSTDESYNKIISIVEQWSKEHPRKTRQSVFLEQYPETELDRHGVLQLCPSIISAAHRSITRSCAAGSCANCRRKFWLQEVE